MCFRRTDTPPPTPSPKNEAHLLYNFLYIVDKGNENDKILPIPGL